MTQHTPLSELALDLPTLSDLHFDALTLGGLAKAISLVVIETNADESLDALSTVLELLAKKLIDGLAKLMAKELADDLSAMKGARA